MADEHSRDRHGHDDASSQVPVTSRRGSMIPSIAGFVAGFVLGLIASALQFDSGPGFEPVHLGVATGAGIVGALLGAAVRR